MKNWLSRGKSNVAATIVRRDDETIVENGLSTTPAQMRQLTEQGIPVSGDALGLMFDDGVKDNPQLPLAERRGIELADLWNAQKSARSKLRDLNNHVPSNE